MDNNEQTADIPAWLQLYLAKKPSTKARLPNVKPVGRPSRVVPAKQTSVWFSAGDREIVDTWQEYLGTLSNQTVSIGEVLSLLARICRDRLEVLGGEDQFDDLTEFTLAMIGENHSEQ